MKIVYVVSAFPKLSETFVLSQINSLIEKGHEVEIIAAGKSKEEIVHEDVFRYGLPEKTHCDVRNPSDLGFGLNERLLSSLVFTDVIHAHFAAEPADLAMKISNMFNIPFIFTAHAYDIFINPHVVKLREKFDKARKVITVSNYNREYLLNLLGRDLEGKIEVIRCGIDLDKIKYVERKAKDTVRILLVGRFVEKKGIPYAIKAFSEVLKEYNNIEFRIIGDGPLREDVANLISESDLEGKVVLSGFQSQSVVLKEMEEADIFLLPSVQAENGDREGVPVAIMEAQATGLPVVSTTHTGIPEVVVDGKTGFLVPEKDTCALAQRLKELINNPALRAKMGKEGREYIQSDYDHNIEMRQLERLLKDSVNCRPLISDLPAEYEDLIKKRIKNLGNQLDGLTTEIKQKDRQLKQLQGHLDAIQSAMTYRIYRTIMKFPSTFKNLYRTGINGVYKHLENAQYTTDKLLDKKNQYPFKLPPVAGANNDYTFLEEKLKRFIEDDGNYYKKVSLVIPVYNRKEILRKTLAALTHQTYPPEFMEILIADDGSSDGVEEVIGEFGGFFDMRHVWQEDKGYRLAEIRNKAIKEAKYDYIILLDCDMLPVPELVEEYMKWFHIADNVVLIGHRKFINSDAVTAEQIMEDVDAVLTLPEIAPANDVVNPGGKATPVKDWRIKIYKKTNFLKKAPHCFGFLCGGNVALYKKNIEAAGYFDESFVSWGHEDMEFGFRLYQMGLYFVPLLSAAGLHQEHPFSGSRKKSAHESKKISEQKVSIVYREYKKGAMYEVPKVSIYIPAFNAEKFIKGAVDSVLNQTFTDLEVCICDDGSTDKTIEVLEKNFKNNPRVKWVTILHGGIGKASNRAVRMCRGAYIGQLDADDMLKPHAVETLAGYLDRHPEVGCVYSTYERINAEGDFVEQGYNWRFFSREKLLNNMVVHHFRMFRKRDWSRTEGFDETLTNAVDYDMYVKLSEVCQFRHLNKVLYQYRLHGKNTSLMATKAQTENTYKVVNNILRKHGLNKTWELDIWDDSNPRNVKFKKKEKV